MAFSRVEDAIAAVGRGEIVVVTDDEERENEGDLIMSYSRFISGLRVAGVEVDRKILADLAVSDPAAFAALVKVAEGARQAS